MNSPTLKRRLEQLEQQVNPEPLIIQVIFGRGNPEKGEATYGPRYHCGGIQEIQPSGGPEGHGGHGG